MVLAKEGVFLKREYMYLTWSSVRAYVFFPLTVLTGIWLIINYLTT
jgi:hypothetical protein